MKKPMVKVFSIQLHEKGEEMHIRADRIDAVGVLHQPVRPGLDGVLQGTGDRIRGMYLVVQGRRIEWNALGADSENARAFCEAVVRSWNGLGSPPILMSKTGAVKRVAAKKVKRASRR